MRWFLLLALLLSTPALAQSYFTDCGGVKGSVHAASVTCPNLPAGVTPSYNQQAVVPHVFPSQGISSSPCLRANHCYQVTAGSADSLQTQIDSAASDCRTHGSVVLVPADNTYTTTSNFNLPATNCDSSHWVVVQSDHLSSLGAQGTRISASTVNMPTLGTSNFTQPVIQALDNPGNWQITGYWLAGLDIEDDPYSIRQFALVILGDGCGAASSGCATGPSLPSTTTISQLTARITIDRCWIHPTQATSNIHFGIRYTASRLAVEDSIIEAHDTGPSPGQPQGLSTDYSFGLIDIGNNEIIAPTENIMFGGSGHVPTNDTTSDIYIHQNYIHKRPEWMDAGGANYFQRLMRNFIECKNCARMLVEGNVFDTDAGNSVSASIQITPRNSGGLCKWCTATDITIRYNKFSNISDWIAVIGANCGSCSGPPVDGPSLPSKRITVHDNVIENLNRLTYGGNGRWIYLSDQSADARHCSGTPNTAACQLSDIIISHNTGAGDQKNSSVVWVVDAITTPPPTTDKGFNVTITNNIFPAGRNGFSANNVTMHPLTSALGAYFSPYSFDGNAITNVTSVGYGNSDFPSPICNFSTSKGCNAVGLPPSMAAVGFVNYNGGIGGDYRICVANGVPSGCKAASRYMSRALAGFGDSSKYSPSPGANAEAVAEMTAGVSTGSYAIASCEVRTRSDAAVHP